MTGEYGVLEVIDSASVFDLTDATLAEIKRIVDELSLIHISEPTRRHHVSRMPSSA